VDEERELAGCKTVLAISALFLFSTYYSWHEFRYMLWGDTAEAQVTRTFETEEFRRRGRRVKRLAVEYSFTDSSNQQTRNERDDVGLDWPIDGETVLVQYIPGEPDASRLSGHRSLLSVLFFFGCLIAVAAFVYKMHREVNSPPARRPPGRRL
jgi:hypothetical protein